MSKIGHFSKFFGSEKIRRVLRRTLGVHFLCVFSKIAFFAKMKKSEKMPFLIFLVQNDHPHKIRVRLKRPVKTKISEKRDFER